MVDRGWGDLVVSTRDSSFEPPGRVRGGGGEGEGDDCSGKGGDGKRERGEEVKSAKREDRGKLKKGKK